MAVARNHSNRPIIHGASVIHPGDGASYITNSGNAEIYNSGESLNFWSILPAQGRFGDYLPVTSSDRHAASGEVSVVYSAPGLYQRHEICGVAWGYDGTPASGSLRIESPSGTRIFGPVPITAAGAGFHDFPQGLKAPENSAVHVILTSAGTTGNVSVKGRRVV